MAPWLRFVEAWAVQALLSSPTFHRAVEKVARRVHRFRHGIPPDELGGTKIDSPENHPKFMQHFVDEIKTQLGAAEHQQEGGVKEVAKTVRANETGANARNRGSTQGSDDEARTDADSVWRDHSRAPSAESENAPAPSGFLGEYMAALREQVRGSKGK